jgi:hypothetical protein
MRVTAFLWVRSGGADDCFGLDGDFKLTIASATSGS